MSREYETLFTPAHNGQNVQQRLRNQCLMYDGRFLLKFDLPILVYFLFQGLYKIIKFLQPF